MASKFREEFLRLPLVRQRLEGESDGFHWWAVSSRDAGAVHLPLRANSERNLFPPLPEQVMFACDMAEALNKHIHHDGRWVVQLVHPMAKAFVPTVAMEPVQYQEFRFLWLDEDGDPQFTFECGFPLEQWLVTPWQSWVQSAEEAHATWYVHMRKVIDPKKEGALYKRAQGEAAPSIGG